MLVYSALHFQIMSSLTGFRFSVFSATRFKVSNDFGFVQLDLTDVYPRDQGIYTCRAWNQAGEAFTTTTVTCKGERRREWYPFLLQKHCCYYGTYANAVFYLYSACCIMCSMLCMVLGSLKFWAGQHFFISKFTILNDCVVLVHYTYWHNHGHK